MRAVVLVNLGTPRSTSEADVREYLREFLMDERVIDYPSWLRWFVVHAFVLPFRPAKSAAKYATVWTPEGSPLMVYGERLQQSLTRATGLRVELAMRYGEPSIPSIVARMQASGVSEVFVVPLYPQYARSTWETVAVAWETAARELAPNLRHSFLQPYHAEPEYLDLLAASAQGCFADRSVDHLLISFHGVPVRHILRGDPSCAHCLKSRDCCHQATSIHAVCYRAQCVQTAEGLARRLGLARDRYTVSFQSRFGPDKWLEPATDVTARELARKGVRRLGVIAPAFAADCLETLEELCGELREEFLHAGGTEFLYVPCLNAEPGFVRFLARRALSWAGLPEPTGT